MATERLLRLEWGQRRLLITIFSIIACLLVARFLARVTKRSDAVVVVPVCHAVLSSLGRRHLLLTAAEGRASPAASTEGEGS